MTPVFKSMGLTRDSATWWWGKVVGIATLVASGLMDPQIGGLLNPTELGVTPRALKWVQLIAGLVIFVSAQNSNSRLPGEKKDNDGPEAQ